MELHVAWHNYSGSCRVTPTLTLTLSLGLFAIYLPFFFTIIQPVFSCWCLYAHQYNFFIRTLYLLSHALFVPDISPVFSCSHSLYLTLNIAHSSPALYCFFSLSFLSSSYDTLKKYLACCFGCLRKFCLFLLNFKINDTVVNENVPKQQ